MTKVKPANHIVDIIIPSYQRPDRVLAYDWYPTAKICIPESEVDAYAENYPRQDLIPHPDSIKGIGAKREWIIRNYPNVFMIDDDIGPIKTINAKHNRALEPNEIYELIQNTAYTAREMGAKMFGFNPDYNPMHFQPMNPFSLRKPFFNAVGILATDKMFYPDHMILGEDDFIFLLTIYYYRYTWCDQRFVTDRSKNAKSGGCVDYRTIEKEKEAALKLQRYFGKNVVEVRENNPNNPNPITKKIRLPL